MTDAEITLRNTYLGSLISEQELLKSYLGVTLDVDFERYVLYPYYDTILRHINNKISEKKATEEDWELRDTVQLVFDEFSAGSDLICELKTTELSENLGLAVNDYSDERMAFSWGHVMTALCTLLRLMYGYLFENEDCDCCNCVCEDKKCCCQNTTSEYESWVSNSYAEDEENLTANYERTNSPWQRSIIKYNDCYRRNTNSEGCSCPCCCKNNNTNNNS